MQNKIVHHALLRRIAILSLSLFLSSSVLASPKVLKVGLDCNLPPFAFVDDNATIIRGFSVDLARLLAGAMGAKLKFYSIASSELQKGLSEGTIDFSIGERPGDKSLQSLDLPIGIERKFFVHRDCLTITCIRDMRPGHKVVILRGSGLEHLLPADRGILLSYADSDEEAAHMVDSGKVDAFLSPNAFSTKYQAQKHHLTNVKEVGLPVEVQPLAITVPKSNMSLLTQLSIAYGKVTENKNYEVIRAKWFGQTTPLAGLEPYLKTILAALALFALALLASFFWNRSLKKSVQAVAGELKRSEEKYRDLIESSPEMIHLISPEGTILLSNRIAASRLGYDKEDSFSLFDLAVSEYREPLAEFVASVFATGRGTREFAFLGKEGARVEIEMTATMFVDPHSADPRACCFSRDISERKRLEEELMQSEKLAIMGQMTAGIAHEINNPLGIILANTEELLLLCEGETRENLQSIERNALRAGKFIDDLLTFTRPTLAEKVRFELVEAIQEALLFCKQQLKKKGITVRQAFPPQPVWFEGDVNQIQQLIVNLLLNSIQAIEDKGSIDIRLEARGDNGTRLVHLEVADTGIGIQEGDLPKIFDLFFTARKNKGFGLGLFICKRIVDKHNGTISAQSTVGRGTLISVSLPDSPGAAKSEQRDKETCGA